RSARARFTHALTDSARPAATASWPARMRAGSTVTVRRSLRVILKYDHDMIVVSTNGPHRPPQPSGAARTPTLHDPRVELGGVALRFLRSHSLLVPARADLSRDALQPRAFLVRVGHFTRLHGARRCSLRPSRRSRRPQGGVAVDHPHLLRRC